MATTSETTVRRPGARRVHYDVLRAFRRGGFGLAAGCVVLVVMLLAGFFLPLRYDEVTTDATGQLLPPSADHWFGTDQLGRDVFARVIASARLDLPLVLAGTALSLVGGVVIGLIASTKGRWSERIMRALDMFQAFPLLVLAMVMVALAGNSLFVVILAIALIYAPRIARLVRSEALALRESRFVEAAVAVGASPVRILRRHLLPNVSGIILVNVALTASRALVVIAGLSYLGIGVSPPTASWGAMIQSGTRNVVTGEWWVFVFPGLAVFFCVIAFNQISDGLATVFGRGARG